MQKWIILIFTVFVILSCECLSQDLIQDLPVKIGEYLGDIIREVEKIDPYYTINPVRDYYDAQNTELAMNFNLCTISSSRFSFICLDSINAYVTTYISPCNLQVDSITVSVSYFGQDSLALTIINGWKTYLNKYYGESKFIENTDSFEDLYRWKYDKYLIFLKNKKNRKTPCKIDALDVLIRVIKE
jgi:hypothetical protein